MSLSTKSYPTILFLSIFSQYLRVRITIIRGSKCCKHAFIVMAKGGRKNMFQCNICHCSATSYCTEVSNHFMVTIILLLASQRLLSCLHTSIECVLFFLLSCTTVSWLWFVCSEEDSGGAVSNFWEAEICRFLYQQRTKCNGKVQNASKYYTANTTSTVCKHLLRDEESGIVDFISTFTCLYGGITVGTLKSLWTGFKPLFALC